MEIEDPVPPHTARRLRQAVLQHRLAERRRLYPPLLHVGEPGELEVVVAAECTQGDGHGLRVEMVEAMLRRVGLVGPAEVMDGRAAGAGAGGDGRGGDDESEQVPLVWLTRPGDLDLQDVDAAWVAAVGSAAAELEHQLPVVVVNRRSWRDPRSGAGREWRRLRPRS